MPAHADIDVRMKTFYEQISKTKLMRRTPVAIRIDGKAFHTFTRGFKKPFDPILVECMQETTKYLCENIQGCVFGYTQSDEISLILVDYQTFSSAAWFDNEVQKICSISASMATMKFNQLFTKIVNEAISSRNIKHQSSLDFSGDDEKYIKALDKAVNRGAMFDSRCFNIPKEEVCNLIYSRQIDAYRNSVQMVGRSYFSDKQLYKKSVSNIQDMLMETYNVNWNDFPTYLKRGTACKKNEAGKWELDLDMPILKNEDRYYVDDLIYIGEGLV